MQNELFINGRDAWDWWGISMDSTALTALMTPAPMKDFISNESRLEHGISVTNINPKKAQRELTLAFNLIANSMEDFLQKYNDFCNNVLAQSLLVINTKYQPGVFYKCYYISCSQFAEYNMTMGKFILKLVEPNPDDRNDFDSED